MAVQDTGKINQQCLDTMDWSKHSVPIGLDTGEPRFCLALTQDELRILHLLLTRKLPGVAAEPLCATHEGLEALADVAGSMADWAGAHPNGHQDRAPVLKINQSEVMAK